MVQRFASLILILLFTTSAVAESDSASAIPVDGQSFDAHVAGIDANWNITFQSADGQRVLAAADVVRWGSYKDTEKAAQIVLADGGVLTALVLKITSDHLIVDSSIGFLQPLWGEVKLPLSAVRGVVFRPPALPLARDRLIKQVAATRGEDDRLLLDNGDVLTGTLAAAAAVEAPANQVRDPTADEPPQTIPWRTMAGKPPIPISLDRVLALIFNPALVDAPKPRGLQVLCGFRDGSLLYVSKAIVEDGRAHLTLTSGIQLQADAATFFEQLTSLQPLTPRVTYLSDLTPIGNKHIPFLSLSWPHGVDENLLGGRLRAGDAAYVKGLSMHSTSRLAYELGGNYSRFQAELAIDASAALRGSVEFRVFLEDSTGTWTAAYKSPIIRGGASPVPITIDITGAQRMALIIDFADRGDELDHANWLDARLVK
jgi:hypothetical protein